MGISLGGIMRGGLPVLSDKLRSNENIKEAAILKVGEKFAQLKDKVNTAEAKNRTYMNNVETVAKSLAMDKDVVYNVFKAYGGNNKTAMNHLKNLANAYVAKGKPVPTMASAQTEQMLPKKEDATISVDAPKEGGDMNVFDKAMSLFKTASPDEIFKEFMNRNPQLNETEVRKIMSNTMNPAYSPSKTIDPKAFVGTLDAADKDKKDDFGRYTYLSEGLAKLIQATRTNPQEFGDNVKAVALLPKQLGMAKQLYKDGDTDKANAIFENIESVLSTVYPTAVAGGDKEAEKKFNAQVDEIMKLHPGEDREVVARELRKTQGKKLVIVDSEPVIIDNVWDSENKKFIESPRVLTEYSRNGIKGYPRSKIIKANEAKLAINSTSINRVGSIIQSVTKYNLGYVSFIANTVKNVSTGQDIFNSIFNSKFNLIPDSVDAEALIQMRQKGIGLIAAAKDQLFNDPRLSDRDLKIVLDYVGVIDSNIGSTQALANMYGLQIALLKDSALRMSQNNPNLALNGPTSDGEQAKGIKVFGKNGAVVNRNESITSRLLHINADSLGIKMLSKDKVAALSEKEYEKYFGEMKMLTGQVYEAIQDVKVYRTLTASEQKAYAATTDVGDKTDPRIVAASDPEVLKRFKSSLPTMPKGS